ncbi:Ig-like domain-containing protein [Actinomyces procaprae]|uniref:Ig-like domain-containing protein n=1 Tax=Actinomyces procaprae TaxID=2560010 RepID=UPI0010A22701|nr:Ig-like domain-containing protein [Actinomyces procaprae]
MRSRAASRLLAVLALGALALAMIAPTAFHTTASAAEGNCTATTETPNISLLKDDEPVSADNTAVAWEMLKLEFDLALEDGHCAGQTYEISTPAELRFDTGTTWNLDTEDGATAATMTYVIDEGAESGRLVITLTDYVESHQDVTLTGWVDTRLTSEVTPSTTETLTFNTNGKVTTVEVPVGECVGNCTEMPRAAGKYGSASAADDNGTRSGSVTIQTPTITEEMAAGRRLPHGGLDRHPDLRGPGLHLRRLRLLLHRP